MRYADDDDNDNDDIDANPCYFGQSQGRQPPESTVQYSCQEPHYLRPRFFAKIELKTSLRVSLTFFRTLSECSNLSSELEVARSPLSPWAEGSRRVYFRFVETYIQPDNLCHHLLRSIQPDNLYYHLLRSLQPDNLYHHRSSSATEGSRWETEWVRRILLWRRGAVRRVDIVQQLRGGGQRQLRTMFLCKLY